MGCGVMLGEWGCASEIKQNLNKIKATPCKPAEVLSVYSSLPKVRAAQAAVARRTGGKLENEEMRSEVELEEWGCASEIKQILNKIKSTPCEMKGEVRRSFQRILERFWTFGRYRRDSEEGREGFWWKRGVRWVGVAYRELIGSLYESWTIGIERVCK